MPKAVTLVIILLCATWTSAARADPEPPGAVSPTGPSSTALLAPPKTDGPVVVRVGFTLHDINAINDVAETFEFVGVMTLTWIDPRQAFEPAPGAEERVFQGTYQFNELATGWYPQMVLVNETGSYQKSGVVLRIRPDGTSTLVETIAGVAETPLDMRWYPFDGHRLEAVFEVPGFDRDEVLLQMDAARGGHLLDAGVAVSEWAITGAEASVQDRPARYAGPGGVASTFVVHIDVERNSFYIRRLVTFPLAAIVLLSFSVFWMDRSSLGDRISVSFIGILTGVAYQLVIADVVPRVAYVTVMHAFLVLSFLTMCATVVINLVVGAADKRGSYEAGDRIDRRCRWIFPLVYSGLVLTILGAATIFF